MAHITHRLVAIPALGLATTIAFAPAALAQEGPSQSNTSDQSNSATIDQSNESTQSNSGGDDQSNSSTQSNSAEVDQSNSADQSNTSGD